MRRTIIGIGGLLLGTLVVAVAYLNAPGGAPADLAQRCTASRPQWPSYQEDIKGHIGARPVAQWKGSPVSAQQSGSMLRVTFHIEQPWAAYAFALPVLLQDPLGTVCRSAQTDGTGTERTYLFVLPDADHESPVPWVMLRFPHGETRIMLDHDGRWMAGAG